MENTILENNLSAWEKKFCGSRVEIENKYANGKLVDRCIRRIKWRGWRIDYPQRQSI